jgi:N-acyl-D-aspartate/D-glutamate deacylase
MTDHDLVIRGGTVVDGTGAPARTADIAIDNGVITEVGAVAGTATRTIDAEGLLVTPGFVDIHCHYDGQASSGIAVSGSHPCTQAITAASSS